VCVCVCVVSVVTMRWTGRTVVDGCSVATTIAILTPGLLKEHEILTQTHRHLHTQTLLRKEYLTCLVSMVDSLVLHQLLDW